MLTNHGHHDKSSMNVEQLIVNEISISKQNIENTDRSTSAVEEETTTLNNETQT